MPSEDSPTHQNKSNGRHDPSRHLAEGASGGGGAAGHAQGQSSSVQVHPDARGFEASYGLMQVLYPMSYGDGLDPSINPESLYPPDKNFVKIK